MTHQNLVLTESAIKAHAKRLKKELAAVGKEISLGETQNILAKSFGFNNFHELKQVLFKETEDYNPLDDLALNFKNKNINKNSYIFFVRPQKPMSESFQKSLYSELIDFDFNQKEQKISIIKIEITREYFVVYLDPNSEFSNMGSGKVGSTIHGAFFTLSNKIDKIFESESLDTYYNFEYGYTIKNNTRFFIHLEDKILIRDGTVSNDVLLDENFITKKEF